jgi:carboxymethylenebutenolidase
MHRAVWFACLLELSLSTSCKESTRAQSGAEPAHAHDTTIASLSKRTIVFRSGEVTLHGVVYVPSGSGPFPAVLWNHGSWGDPMEAFDLLAPTFVNAGWVFFGPFRRGQGLSSSAGPYILDELERAGRRGMQAKEAKLIQLLTREHLDDQLAAYAWLEEQPNVIASRIAVAGNSFGGVEAVLGAERVAYCAAINGAGGSGSWSLAPALRDVMTRAARASRAPMFLFQAKNDFDLSPSRTLARAMKAADKTVVLRLYPAYGSSVEDGHGFAWRGNAIWGNDVLAFLARHCAG